jgi:predicted  nucleic acid-binding Zn-ribbon protein
MRYLRSLPAFALLLGALALSSSAQAQPAFRLTSPTLFVDRIPMEVDGAALPDASVERLALAVPGHGTYLIAAEPFAGARRVGQFTEETLAFTVEGQTVWLVNDYPMLDTEAPVPAFVRFVPASDAQAAGPARLVIPAYESVALPAQAFAARPHEPEASSTETAALNAEIETLQRRRGQILPEDEALEAERHRLAQEIAQLEISRASATSQRRLLAEARDRLREELDALQRDIEAYEDEVGHLQANRDRLTEEREQRAAGLSTVRLEVETLEATVARLDSQNARLTAEQARLADEHRRLLDESEALEETVPALEAELPQLRTERDRLLQEQAHLHETQNLLAQEVSDLQATVEAAAAETQRLERARAEVLAEQARLESERERLGQAEAELATDSLVTLKPAEESPAQPFPSTTSSTLTMALPDFDFGRLQNADEVRSMMTRTEAPGTTPGNEMERLVAILFATNETGEVVDAAVEEPLDSALDPLHALAVALVRRMVFVPREMNGQPAALYARVVVRFAR